MASIREQLLQPVREFIAALNRWDLDALVAARSPNCLQYTLPATFEKGPMKNKEFYEVMSGATSLVWNYNMFYANETEADSVTVDVEARKVTAHVKSTRDSVVGPFKNEYVIMFWINEDGKLDRVDEFLDSGASLDFMARLKPHMK